MDQEGWVHIPLIAVFKKVWKNAVHCLDAAHTWYLAVDNLDDLVYPWKLRSWLPLMSSSCCSVVANLKHLHFVRCRGRDHGHGFGSQLLELPTSSMQSSVKNKSSNIGNQGSKLSFWHAEIKRINCLVRFNLYPVKD